eukprot:6193127-Pleurochrysis_carterae.AAC.4
MCVRRVRVCAGCAAGAWIWLRKLQTVASSGSRAPLRLRQAMRRTRRLMVGDENGSDSRERQKVEKMRARRRGELGSA